MKRDTRNNYALFWNGRYCGEVHGYRDALSERHALAARQASNCNRPNTMILDTPAVSECCGCQRYCRATISKEVR